MARTTRRDFLKTSGSLAAGLMTGAACQQGGTPPPQQQASKRPNFLFFFPDQHRWDWMPHNPAIPLPAPNIEALSRRGLTFERAYCAAPVCAPSRACLASGREYDHCGVPTNGQSFPRDRTTFYRLLRDSGYHVLGCGKQDLASQELRAGELGLDGRRFSSEWGFSDAITNAGKGAGSLVYLMDPVGPKDSYYAYLDGLEVPQGLICAEDFRDRRAPERDEQWGKTYPSPLAKPHYCDNWISRNGLELLDAVPEGDPWFLIINFAGPHPPMDITKEMERHYRGPDRVIEDFPQPHNYEGPWDEEHQIRIRQNYAAMIENIDDWLGRYIEKLEERGELDNTVIVYSSDHGEMLGDHTRWGKQIPHESSSGVPLVLAGPGIEPGRRSDALVSLIDLTATFLDLGGAEVPEEMDGFSLRHLLAGQTEVHREYVLSGLYDWRMVVDGQYKLITNYEGAEQRLYDLREDPWEDVDLASKDPERCRRLLELMQQGSYRPV